MTAFQRLPRFPGIVSAGLAAGLLSASTAFAAIVEVHVTPSGAGLYSYSATVTSDAGLASIDEVEFAFFTAGSLPELPSIASPFGWSSGFVSPSASGWDSDPLASALPASAQSVLRYTFDRGALVHAQYDRNEKQLQFDSRTLEVDFRTSEASRLAGLASVAQNALINAEQVRNTLLSSLQASEIRESSAIRDLEDARENVDRILVLQKFGPYHPSLEAQLLSALEQVLEFERALEDATGFKLAVETQLISADYEVEVKRAALMEAEGRSEFAWNELDSAERELATAGSALHDAEAALALRSGAELAGGKAVGGFGFVTNAAPASGPVLLTRADGTGGLVDTQVPGSPSAVPLPASLPLLLAGLFAMGALRRSRLGAS